MGWKGILNIGKRMLQLHHEVKKYGKFRGKLVRTEGDMVKGRDREPSKK